MRGLYVRGFGGLGEEGGRDAGGGKIYLADGKLDTPENPLWIALSFVGNAVLPVYYCGMNLRRGGRTESTHRELP